MNLRPWIEERSLLLIFFFFTILPLAAGADSPLLRAVGTRLLDGQGRPVQLKGVNLGGWLLQETWMTPVKGSSDHWSTRDLLSRRFGTRRMEQLFQIYEDHWITAADLDEIKKLGFNVLRVPFGYWNLQDEGGKWRRKTDGAIDFGRLEWIEKEAGLRGLYVILDLHGAPGFASDAHSSGRVDHSRLFAEGDEGEALRLRTIDLWREIARHFRGSVTIAAYDLLNEPMAKPSDPQLWGLYDRIYRAIRENDPDHLVSVEAVWEVTNLPDPKELGWTKMLYQTHDYGWDQNQASFLETKMKASALSQVYGVPLLVGEFNAFAWPADWERTLLAYDRAGFQWTTWTYKLTKSGTTNWALFSSPFVPSPNVAEDSDAKIAEDWSQTETFGGNFARNDILLNLLSQSLSRKPYPSGAEGPGK